MVVFVVCTVTLFLCVPTMIMGGLIFVPLRHNCGVALSDVGALWNCVCQLCVQAAVRAASSIHSEALS